MVGILFWCDCHLIVTLIVFANFDIVVNGQWGKFGPWENCSVPCGGANHSRFRACDSPAPLHDGYDCTVDGSNNKEVRACNVNPCPG